MRPLALLFLLAAASFAQTDGIVTTVSRTVTLTPDEADFSVIVATSLDFTQDQVLQIFHDAGVQNLTVANVAAVPNNITYPPPGNTLLSYQVNFTTAPAAMKTFSKLLDGMKGKLPDGVSSLQFSAALNASQAVVDAAHATVLPLLLQDARTKGQALATAAGLKLGAITGLTESNYAPAPYAQTAIYAVLASAPPLQTVTQYTFFATVKFAVQ